MYALAFSAYWQVIMSIILWRVFSEMFVPRRLQRREEDVYRSWRDSHYAESVVRMAVKNYLKITRSTFRLSYTALKFFIWQQCTFEILSVFFSFISILIDRLDNDNFVATDFIFLCKFLIIFVYKWKILTCTSNYSL